MNIKTKIKAILTIIFSSVLILSMSACKTNKEADRSSSEPTEITATTTTTTLPTTTTATTTTTRKTATSKATTTTTTATTTVTTTTTTAPTTTQLTTTTVATTTTTAVPVVATTTTTTTAAPIVATTTTVAVTATSTVTSTAATAIPTGNLTPTLKAYSDLAETGILTDEIRQLITEDVLNYATSKYDGLIINPNLYANSKTDYNATFYGGAKNEYFKSATPEEIALYESWGIDMSAHKNATLEQYARGFQEEIFCEVDSALAEGSQGIGCYVGFCELYREGDYVTYQVSFLLGLNGLI